jgi:hypothetical protein
MPQGRTHERAVRVRRNQLQLPGTGVRGADPGRGRGGRCHSRGVARRREDPTGRLRDLAWSSALLGLAAVVTRMAFPFVSPQLQWWVLLIPASAAIILAVRPSLARGIVPVALIPQAYACILVGGWFTVHRLLLLDRRAADQRRQALRYPRGVATVGIGPPSFVGRGPWRWRCGQARLRRESALIRGARDRESRCR